MSNVNLHCMTEIVACCHFHHGPEEQTISATVFEVAEGRCVSCSQPLSVLQWQPPSWSASVTTWGAVPGSALGVEDAQPAQGKTAARVESSPCSAGVHRCQQAPLKQPFLCSTNGQYNTNVCMKWESLSLDFRWARCPVPSLLLRRLLLLIKLFKMCCLTQSRTKPHVISCRANEAILFTGVDFHFSEAQHSSTGYSSLTRRVQTLYSRILLGFGNLFPWADCQQWWN